MKHLIKIESTPHGVLGVRHAGFDQQYCEAGEQVILKWQPDAKWGLQEAHYTDGEGNVTPIDLTPVKVNGKDVVVFTMPNANITIGGTFKMFVSQDWTEGTNPSKGEVLTVGNNGEPTPISVDELANEIAEGDNNLVDSIDAINPFKGWYANLATLQASHPSPQVGDYAYIKGAESTDPAAIYECTTAGSWSDSGRTADTSNVQTFASSEEVNEVHIVNDFTTGGEHDVASAETVKELKEIIGKTEVPITANNAYIKTSGSIGSTIPSPTSDNGFHYYRFSVSEGDIVMVNAVGGSSPRAWCFVDSNNKIVSQSSYGTIVATLTVPSGVSEIIINQSNSDTNKQYYISKESLIGSIKVADSKTNDFYDISIRDASGKTEHIIAKVKSNNIFNLPGLVSQSAIYETCIKEVWINPKFISNNNTVFVKCYGNKLCAGIKSNNNIIIFSENNIVNSINGEVIKMTITSAVDSNMIGEVLGYIVFSDISTFKSNDYGGTETYLNIDRAISLDYNRTIWYETMSTEEKVEEVVENIVNQDLDVLLPPTIYATVGVELNLYNDSIAASVDNGLLSPVNYRVKWVCSKGIITERGYRFTPTASDANTSTTITCYVYNNIGLLITQKTASIVVKSASISGTKNILFIGDSTGSETVNAIYNDFQTLYDSSGDIPLFVGSKGTTPKWEGFGGARWTDFATEGRVAFRLYVGADAFPIEPNTTCTNNGQTWEIVEVNITQGVGGNILITQNALPDESYNTPTTPSGTIVYSGRSINYTDCTEVAGNPLWYNDAVDFSHYRTVNNITNVIDIVAIQLGCNGYYETNSELLQYIGGIYDAAISDNPNCKVIISFNAGPANTAGASGNAGDTASTIERFWRKKKLYLTMLESGDYPNLRIANPWLSVDRYYGFPMATRAVSSRYTSADESYHTNYIHPSASGYEQDGDSWFSAIIGVLNE